MSMAPIVFNSVAAGSNQAHNSTKMPITKLPRIAPNGLPKPPKVTAAKISNNRRKPMSHCTPMSRP